MKHTRERNVMTMMSFGKTLRSFLADKNLEDKSWPENSHRVDMSHDVEQPGENVSPKVVDLDKAIQPEENGS